jgi:hypothetical protein
MFKIPMRRTRSPCCALVATGHTTAPPNNAMKSRRLIKTPEAQTRNASNLHTYSGRGTTLRMSASDMFSAKADVRFGSEADIEASAIKDGISYFPDIIIGISAGIAAPPSCWKVGRS